MDEYTIIDYPVAGKNHGRYRGKSPGQAARKVLNYLARKSGIDDDVNVKQRFLVFTIQNIKNKKDYKYIGTRVKMHRPVQVELGGKTVQYNYTTHLTKWKKEYESAK